MRNNYTPIMLIDAETVSRHPRMLDVVEHLSDRRHDPKWSREQACHGCLHWQTKDGLGNLPFRPGRGSAAVEGCSGCWYSMLDYAPEMETVQLADLMDGLKRLGRVVVENAGNAHVNPAPGLALRKAWLGFKLALATDDFTPVSTADSWAVEVRPRRGRRPSTRVLRLDTVEHQQGYAGKRATRPGPAFQPPNKVGETCECGCGGKAKVERWWSLGKDKKEPQRFVAITCMAGCPRVTKPEDEWPVTPAPVKPEDKKR